MADQQPKRRPTPKTFAIRDDGMLYPAFDSVLRNPRYRPYHGDPNASLEQRLAYLRGENARNSAKEDAERGVFNITTAEKDELIEFMLDEYGFQLDSRLSIEKLRSQAIMHIQVKQAEESGLVGQAGAADVDADLPAAKTKPAARKGAGIAATTE